MPNGEIETIDRGDGVRLAFQRNPGAGPTLVWLSGFKSDMGGTKAEALANWSASAGRGFLRLDYSGCGQSGGRFEDGTISRWLADALCVIDAASAGPLTLVGSSMGGWIALLAALARPQRMAALLLIAPAPDFTETLMWESFSDEVRAEILEQGRWARPSAYDPEPYVITRALIEDGRRHVLLDGPIPITAPVRILQGMQDPDVPWRHALALVDALAGADVALTLIKDGDHRLSRPQDLERLIKAASLPPCGPRWEPMRLLTAEQRSAAARPAPDSPAAPSSSEASGRDQA
jgi:pimeloyl-ACP methyl ester carboxylesterase